jgi:hypothetical protein
MPLDVIQNEVKDKWRVDVNPSMMYRAHRKAKQKLSGKVVDQYGRLWDYCETLRQTNSGSCVVMKVDRPNPDFASQIRKTLCFFGSHEKRLFRGL